MKCYIPFPPGVSQSKHPYGTNYWVTTTGIMGETLYCYAEYSIAMPGNINRANLSGPDGSATFQSKIQIHPPLPSLCLCLSLSSSPCVYVISLLFFCSFFRRISLEKPKPSKLSMFYALMPFPMGPPDSWVNISHTLHLHKSVYTLLSQIKWKHKFLR